MKLFRSTLAAAAGVTAMAAVLAGSAAVATNASAQVLPPAANQTVDNQRARIQDAYAWHADVATHSGDKVQLTVQNGATAQTVIVRSSVNEIANRQHSVIISETVELKANESKTYSATNSSANDGHLQVNVISKSKDLKLNLVVTDKSGQQSASMNQAAFRVIDTDDIKGKPGQGHGPRPGIGQGQPGQQGQGQQGQGQPGQGQQGQRPGLRPGAPNQGQNQGQNQQQNQVR